jgi:hypothetical protein
VLVFPNLETKLKVNMRTINMVKKGINVFRSPKLHNLGVSPLVLDLSCLGFHFYFPN